MNLTMPDFCNFMISEECMFRCKMCYSWKMVSSSEKLTVSDWKHFLRNLKRFINGTFEINISGGEPFLKEDIFDFIRLCVEAGFITSVTSNGYLIDEFIARKIRATGLHKLSISIDSTDEAVHDFLRGVEGSCRRAVEALGTVYGICENIQLGVQTIIQEKNLDNLVTLARWVQQDERIKYLNFMAIMQPHFENRDKEWFKGQENKILWPQDVFKAHSVIEELIKLKENGKIANSVYQLKAFKVYFEDPYRALQVRGCSIGSQSINLDPKGNVYLCHSLEPIGNIKNEAISDIWGSEKAKQVRHKMGICKENCELSINCFCEEG